MHEIKVVITLELRQEIDGEERWEPLPTTAVTPGTITEVLGKDGKPFARVHVQKVEIL